MYRNILKKDIKRKKTMNIILLLFTILATVFVASGISNVINVVNGTEYFLDKAGIGDYVVITQDKNSNVKEIIEKSEDIESYRSEECIWTARDNLVINGEKPQSKNNALLIQPLQDTGINFFLKDNKKLDYVEKGTVYITAGFLRKNNAKEGDTLVITKDNKTLELKIAGEVKDALLGSEMMGNLRLIVSDEDYETLKQNGVEAYIGNVYYINSDNIRNVEKALSDGTGILFDGGRKTIRMCYIMEMIVAFVGLVLSVCLIIVSFVLLKFVITFSIKEEFREIGVMKAIGIKNRKIRSLYLAKYILLAIAGGIVGLGISIPFGKMMIASVSEKMVLGNDVGIWLNVAGMLLVILLMTGFAYFCTKSVKKAAPLDAFRTGETGERYRKKSICHLYKSHTKNYLFMAWNDILSAPKRFVTIILSFFICSILVMGVVLVKDTMESKNLISTFGKESDVYITDSKFVKLELLSDNGSNIIEEEYKKIEADMAEEGCPCTVSMEVWYRYNAVFNGETYKLTCQHNDRTKASDYKYIKGAAPKNADEIAITPTISEMTGARIGDVITIDFGTEKKDCMVVGYFQSMNQLGRVIRLSEDAPVSGKYANTIIAYQIDFNDDPDDKEIAKRIEMIKEKYDIENVFDAAGYCANCIGVTGTMNSVTGLMLLITGIVVILVSVLMERSFISDEKGQIALLYAIGFKNTFVLKWHVLRFVIIAALSELLAVALVIPFTKLWCNPIFKTMGATHIVYCFKPLSLLVAIPLTIIVITTVTAFITSLYTKKIKSKDISNIE